MRKSEWVVEDCLTLLRIVEVDDGSYIKYKWSAFDHGWKYVDNICKDSLNDIMENCDRSWVRESV